MFCVWICFVVAVLCCLVWLRLWLLDLVCAFRLVLLICGLILLVICGYCVFVVRYLGVNSVGLIVLLQYCVLFA